MSKPEILHSDANSVVERNPDGTFTRISVKGGFIEYEHSTQPTIQAAAFRLLLNRPELLMKPGKRKH